MGDKLLTSADLAEEIKKPEKTLAMWRWQGIGPRYIKVGRDVRYRRRDVERWLDEQTVATH